MHPINLVCWNDTWLCGALVPVIRNVNKAGCLPPRWLCATPRPPPGGATPRPPPRPSRTDTLPELRPRRAVEAVDSGPALNGHLP